jgi:hypothetical protein
MKRSIVKVVYQEGLLPWRVQATNNPYPSMSFKSKEQAVLYARKLAKSANGILKIHGLDKKIGEEHSYGPSPAGAHKKVPATV